MKPSQQPSSLVRNLGSEKLWSQTTVGSTALVRASLESTAEQSGEGYVSSRPHRVRYVGVYCLLRASKNWKMKVDNLRDPISRNSVGNVLVSAMRALAAPARSTPRQRLLRVLDVISSFASSRGVAEPGNKPLCRSNRTRSMQGAVSSIKRRDVFWKYMEHPAESWVLSWLGIVLQSRVLPIRSVFQAVPGHAGLRSKLGLLAVILRPGAGYNFDVVAKAGHWRHDPDYSRSRPSSLPSSANEMGRSIERAGIRESVRVFYLASLPGSRARAARIVSLASILAVLAVNAGAADATMRVMAHPRVVRIVVEGAHVSARHFEHTGSVARLSFAEPVHLSVPSVPTAARPWLAAAELRQEGRVLALALGPQVRAQLAPAQAGRVVIDLEIADGGREGDRSPEVDAGRTGTYPLHVRLDRHRELWRIVFEGEATADLVARPGVASLGLFGPPTLLAQLAKRVSGLGEPILGTTLDHQGLTVRLSPGVTARLRRAKPNEVVVDLVPSARLVGRAPVASANSGERPSSGPDLTNEVTRAQSNAVGRMSGRAEARATGARPDRAPDVLGEPCRADAGDRFLCIRGHVGAEEAELWLIAEPRPRIAAFTRAGAVWIALDRVLDETDVELAGIGNDSAITALKHHSLSDATVLQLQHKRPFFPAVFADAKGWRLSLRPDPELRAVEEARVARLADPPSLSIAMSEKPIILPSRLIGSELVVIPTDAAAGLLEPRRLVDLELLASGRGVVWRPAADDLEMRGSPGQLVVSRTVGLNLDLRDRAATQAAVAGTGVAETASNLATAAENSGLDIAPRAQLEQGQGAIGSEIVSWYPVSPRPQLSIGSSDPVAVASVTGEAHGIGGQRGLGPTLSPAWQLEVPMSAPVKPSARKDGSEPMSQSAEAALGTPPGPTTARASLASDTGSGRSDRAPDDSAGSSATPPARPPLPNPPGAEENSMLPAGAEAEALGSLAVKRWPAGDPSREPIITGERARGPRTSEEAARLRNAPPPAHRAATSPIGLARRELEPEPLLAQRRSELLERRARSEGGERAALGIELARLELGRGRAAEGLAFLEVPTSAFDPDAEPPSDIAVRALTGVAGILLGRLEAADRLLADQRLDGDPEAALWRGVAAGLRQDWVRAARAIAESGRSFQALPPALQRRLTPIVGRVLVEDGRASTALALIERVRRLDPEPHEIQKLALVEGLARAREGATDDALSALREAGAGPDLTTAVEANYRSALLEYMTGRKNAEQVSKDLERQRLAWRGHPMEAELLDGLTQLQLATGKVADAIATARERRVRRPDRPASELVAVRLAESLQTAISRAAEGVGDPLTALRALRTDPDLLPTGQRGAALARRLANRLARDGFPASAASVLEDHGLPRVDGVARAELLLDIAELRLRAGEPAEARATLERVEMTAVRAPTVRARAESLHAALDTSSATSPERMSAGTSPAQILEAAWQARDWRVVIDAGERLLGGGPLSTAATWTDTDKRTVLLRMAFAYAAQGERETARALLDRHAALLGEAPEAMLAALITEVRLPTGNATALARDLDSELAALRAGLSLAR